MLARSPEHREFVRAKFPIAFELFYAIMEGTEEEVRNRLAAGDDPNARGIQGATPLGLAVRRTRDLPKAEALLAAGALIDVWDHCGMHPIHWVTEFGDYALACLTWLLHHGAGTNLTVRQAIKLQFYPVGWTPLHIACRRGLIPTTGLLIGHGANVNYAAEDGSTPLHVAASQRKVYKRLIRTLLDAGANVNATDSQGRSALHILAAGSSRYRKTVIQLLRHRGARLDIRDASGHRPIDLVPDSTPVSEAIRRILA